MKKIYLLLAFVLTVSVANAWTKNCEEGIVIMATKHLTPKAKAVVDKHLGSSYGDDVLYLNTLETKKQATHSKEIHYVHLDGNMQPKSGEGDDALKALEAALDVVRGYETHSEAEVRTALRVVINLMSDIHHLSNYRFESIPYSQATHKFIRHSYDYGKKKEETSRVVWDKMWYGYSSRYSGFSGDFWAYEMNICRGKKFEEFSEGSLRYWVYENASTAASYLNKYTPDYVMSPFEFHSLEDVNYDMMARASFRLAALLNNTIK